MSFKRSKSINERTLSTAEEQMKVLDIIWYFIALCTLVQTLIFYLPFQCLHVIN